MDVNVGWQLFPMRLEGEVRGGGRGSHDGNSNDCKREASCVSALPIHKGDHFMIKVVL